MILESKDEDILVIIFFIVFRKFILNFRFSCFLEEFLYHYVFLKLYLDTHLNLVFRKHLYLFFHIAINYKGYYLSYLKIIKETSPLSRSVFMFWFLLVIILQLYFLLLALLPILAPTFPIWTCRPVLFTLESLVYLQKFFRRFIFFNMVYSYNSTAYLCPIEIINSQNRWSLVFICQKCKSFGFASYLISCKSQINYLSKLWKDNRNISLTHSIIETSHVNVSAIILHKKPITSECHEADPLMLFLSSLRLNLSMFFILCISIINQKQALPFLFTIMLIQIISWYFCKATLLTRNSLFCVCSSFELRF